MEMLELILANQRQPNDPFSPQLLMAIFWEEGLFTNKKQQVGTAIGFGQTEPAELPKLTTPLARERGYDVPGVSASTTQLSDALAVTAPSCLLLHMFHASKAPTREGKADSALRGYAGVDFKGKSSLTREDRLRIIGNWRKCEEKLKALPFSVYTIVNYPGRLADLEERYMDALAIARPFVRDYTFSKSPLVRFRDLLFPNNWFLPGFDRPATPNRGAASKEESAPGRERFVVVAGPGECLGRLAHGDVLVRQPRNGGPPEAARITSARVSSDDFFEGFAAESAPGLYVEVESARGRPVVQRIADRRRNMASGTMVMRPVTSPWGETEQFDEATDAELQRQRTTLVGNITRSDLYWHEVSLEGGYRILVSSPVMKDDLFVPVTAKETMTLARRFEVFPLTRAVMDQAHNGAVQVGKPQSPRLFDFVTYSARLKPTAYYQQFGYTLTSGAHKLWVISSRGPVINYGFYIPRVRGEMVRCGPRLDSRLNVIQSLGARHNGAHWDYSQLLQFMSRLLDPDGQPVNLRQALLDKHPAVWDEAQPPAAGSLP